VGFTLIFILHRSHISDTAWTGHPHVS